MANSYPLSLRSSLPGFRHGEALGLAEDGNTNATGFHHRQDSIDALLPREFWGGESHGLCR